MSSKKLFSDWYGYDKIVNSPMTKFTNNELGYVRTGYTGTVNHYITPSGAEAIKSLPREIRETMVSAWYPESDGLTEDDFIAWVASGARSNDKLAWRNWRHQTVGRRNPLLKEDYWFNRIIGAFFSYRKRSDRIFRIIEINEFLHNADSDQTFENFLETDPSYQTKCKNLEFTIYTELSKKLISREFDIPKFLKFGPGCSLTVREKLLKLDQSGFEKLLDWENNDYYSSSATDASPDYVDLFIGAALGKAQKISVKEMSGDEVKNIIMTEFLSGSPEFWTSLSAKRSLTGAVATVVDELNKLLFKEVEFTRNFAYLISTGVLSKLSPLEVIALTMGYQKSTRWAAPNKGDTTLEVATRMMIEKKLKPEFFAKLVSYIVINNLDLIVVDDDLADHSFDDVPTHWAYPIITKSNQKRKLVHHKAVLALM